MSHKAFSITPIGGTGEIGSNFTLVETDSTQIAIDCGMLFPYEDFFDINYLIPDFSQVNRDKIKALVITHGHEDHIGAIAHFLKNFPEVTVYCSNFTRLLIIKRCLEHNLTPNLILFKEGDELVFNDLHLHLFHVNHSIPETHGVLIHDKKYQWGAVWISDFKIDTLATHEGPATFSIFRDVLSQCQKSAFFLDSTNILRKGKTSGEDELLPDLQEVVQRPHERVYVTLFASNVHRLNHLCQMAKSSNRKIVVMGRSMEHYLRSGIEAGLVQFNEEDIHSAAAGKEMGGRLLVLVSGCQGDHKSALRRLASNEDTNLKINKDDLVVFSSKVIPGNEKKISRIYNMFTEAGAEIVTAYDKHIHASGHPSQDDILEILKFYTPNLYFPIHGESFFLRRHKEFVEQHHPKIRAEIIYNYQQVIFQDSGEYRIKQLEPKEPLLIHGHGIEIERTQISQRRKLACQGVVFISIHRKNPTITLSTQGLPLGMKNHEEELKNSVILKVNECRNRDAEWMAEQVRIFVRQWYRPHLGYKPIAEVHVLE